MVFFNCTAGRSIYGSGGMTQNPYHAVDGHASSAHHEDEREDIAVCGVHRKGERYHENAYYDEYDG